MYKVIELQKPVWTATEGVSAETPFFTFWGIYKMPKPFLTYTQQIDKLRNEIILRQ